MDNIDELRRWMADYSKQLKMVKMPGALPQSAQKEFDKFVVCCQHLISALSSFHWSAVPKIQCLSQVRSLLP